MIQSIHNIQLTPIQQATENYNIACMAYIKRKTKKNEAAYRLAQITLQRLEDEANGDISDDFDLVPFMYPKAA